MDIASILNRAAEKCGFIRTRYLEKDFPSSISDITVMMFFGDMRSTVILSSMLLKRYREEMKGSKYFILCSWPGCECLFPYVNEYWTIKDEGPLSKVHSEAIGFTNYSSFVDVFHRNLNHFFEEVLDFNVLIPYYNNGITQNFWDRFKHVKVSKPSVPSSAILGMKFNKDLAKHRGYKVFLYPSKHIQSWRHKLIHIRSFDNFWVELAQHLLGEGFTPVIYQDFSTYNISSKLTDRCIYFEDRDIFKILGVMRAVDCTLDIFNSISRLSILARSPFIAYDERLRYSSLKEFEFDGLCCDLALPREYIYGFANIIENGNLHLWKNSLFANIVNRLNKFLPDLNRDNLPIPSEDTTIVPYERVRQYKSKRLGVKFIKVQNG